MANKNPFIKPYLKWAGGKRQILPEIRKYIPHKYSVYYEPFIGAGALLFSLQPKKAIINDCNEQLILTYKVIKNNVNDLIILLNEHNEKTCEQYYYDMRSQDRTESFKTYSDIQKAARLIYLNKTCFNGLYRVNSQGLFNVPYGKYKNPSICEPAVLKAINNYFNNNDITIMSGDFEQSIKNIDKNSFVYFDPPYHSPDNTNFTGYQAGIFGEREQMRLQNVYTNLTSKGIKCLLSNSDTEFIRNLYKYNIIETVSAMRTINSNGNGRGKVNELLIRNW